MTKHIPLAQRLKKEIPKSLSASLKVSNYHALPQLSKVVVSTGLNRNKFEGKEAYEYVAKCLGDITGQKAVLTRSRKSISNFKIREGMVVGARVTLRGKQMVAFLDRLIGYVLPRIRDFRGLPTKLDGHGNYSIGLRDHTIFPEVPPADAKQIFGIQVQISTTADSDSAARELLRAMGVPFRQEKKDESGRRDSAKAIESSVKNDDTTASS